MTLPRRITVDGITSYRHVGEGGHYVRQMIQLMIDLGSRDHRECPWCADSANWPGLNNGIVWSRLLEKERP